MDAEASTSHRDEQRDLAALVPAPAAATVSSWRFWAELVPDHPVWTGRFKGLHVPPALGPTTDEFAGDLALFGDTTH